MELRALGRATLMPLALAVVALQLAFAWLRPSSLSPAETSSVLQRLSFSQHPDGLDSIHLLARETWTPGRPGDAADVETDQVSFYRSVPIEIQQTENDQPLSLGQVRQQRKLAQITERQVDQALADGADATAGRLLNLNGEVWPLSRFVAQFVWAGEVEPDGTLTLHFAPAPGLHPGSRLQRILSHSAGTLRVDAATGQLLGGDFHSLGPVTFGAGLLANISQFSGSFDLQPANGCWVMKKVTVSVRGRELFHRIDGTETMDYTLLPTGLPR